MKQLLFFLLISATVQGQSEGQKLNAVLNKEDIKWLRAGDTAKPKIMFSANPAFDWYYVDSVGEIHKLHFDTIPGAMQVIFWRKPFGCRECEDFQTYWTGGYEVKSWYNTSQFYADGRIYDKTYYLQSDKEPMPEGVTVALFVKRPQR